MRLAYLVVTVITFHKLPSQQVWCKHSLWMIPNFFQVARRCLSFLHNGVQEMTILDINCPKGSVACWVLLSALEVLQTCKDFSQNSTSTQVQQYCFYTAELWSYCREKMLLLGEIFFAFQTLKAFSNMKKVQSFINKNVCNVVVETFFVHTK